MTNPALPRRAALLLAVGLLGGATAKAAQAARPDPQTGAAGIKEALAVGTENAVKSLSRENGYFSNAAVKILMPPKLQKLADLARKAGLQRPVDEFVLSMNRAAEAAAPLAARHFGDAIRGMSLQDAGGILTGGPTAATEFFRARTGEALYRAFKPVVSRKVGEVGATQAYKNLLSRVEKLPLSNLGNLGGLGQSTALDLDDYVTRKSLDGLFHMVGEEEKKIRANPLARTTDLLRAVFGK